MAAVQLCHAQTASGRGSMRCLDVAPYTSRIKRQNRQQPVPVWIDHAPQAGVRVTIGYMCTTGAATCLRGGRGDWGGADGGNMEQWHGAYHGQARQGCAHQGGRRLHPPCIAQASG